MRLVLCEGKHAISALEGVLIGAFDCRLLAGHPRPEWFRPRTGSGENLSQLQTISGEAVCLHGTGGKDPLWKALDYRLSAGRLPGTEFLGVCFDPDRQSEEDWRNAIESRLNRADGATARNAGWEYELVYQDGTRLGVFPLPWLAIRDTIPGSLENVQSLYRTTVESLSSAFPNRGALVERWASEASGNGVQLAWKALVWFWMAGWHSDAECTHFFREVLSQQSIHERLRNSRTTENFWRGLEIVAA